MHFWRKRGTAQPLGLLMLRMAFRKVKTIEGQGINYAHFVHILSRKNVLRLRTQTCAS